MAAKASPKTPSAGLDKRSADLDREAEEQQLRRLTEHLKLDERVERMAQTESGILELKKEPMGYFLNGGLGFSNISKLSFFRLFFKFLEKSDRIFRFLGIFCVVSINVHPKMFLGIDVLAKTKF